ncbi:MAG: DNA-protecting protein DprA, partial [Proteobacteria bacterium]|nr:DNA-protecting protein DprA [Pseudomonadota bacterium]
HHLVGENWLAIRRGVCMTDVNAEMGRDLRYLSIALWHYTEFSSRRISQFVAECGQDDSDWDAVWNGIRGGCSLPGLFQAIELGKQIEDEYLSKGTRILCPHDAGYPESLYGMRHAPIVGVRGHVELLKTRQVAIVGSRRTVSAAVQMTPVIADEVMSRGMVVTSGGALGIDALAHRQAMKRQQPTIIVSAIGTAKIFPRENADIFEWAAENGAIVSQFPNRDMAHKPNFPQRNEVIAALSCAVIVVQCPFKSGALYTAQAATRFGKPVFAAAMPGFDELTAGGLDEIRRGTARILYSPACLDSIEMPGQKVLSFEPAAVLREDSGESLKCEPLPPVLLSDTQDRIMQILAERGLTREILRSEAGQPGDFNESLLELELSGLVMVQNGVYSACVGR